MNKRFASLFIILLASTGLVSCDDDTSSKSDEPTGACSEDKDCASNPDGNKCDTASHSCYNPTSCNDDSACASNADGRTKCNAETHVCYNPDACVSDSNCEGRSDGMTKCNLLKNVCYNPDICNIDSDCAVRTDGKVKCDTSIHACYNPLVCDDDAACAGNSDGRIKCDKINRVCYNPDACDNDLKCANRDDGKTVCNFAKKVCENPLACDKDSVCKGRTDGKVKCDETTNLCYNPDACTGDSDCEGRNDGKIKCDTDKLVCYNPDACDDDDACKGRSDGKIKCDMAINTCYNPDYCDDDSVCLSRSDDNKKCNVAEHMCVNVDFCNTQADCASRNDGKIKCNESAHLCMNPDACSTSNDCASRTDDKKTCDPVKLICVSADFCSTDEACANASEGRTQCDLIHNVCITPDADYDGIGDDADSKPHFNETTNTLYVYSGADIKELANILKARTDSTKKLNVVVVKDINLADGIEVSDSLASNTWESLGDVANIDISTIDNEAKTWSFTGTEGIAEVRYALQAPLFAKLSNASISDLILDVDAKGSNAVAVLAEEIDNSTVKNVVVSGSITNDAKAASGSVNENVGVLAAVINQSKVIDTYCEDVSVSASGYYSVGCLAGSASNSSFSFESTTIKNKPNVISGLNSVGGYIGHAECTVSGTDCGVSHIVNDVIDVNSADGRVGGLIGEAFGIKVSTINNTVLRVAGDSSVGGLIGYAENLVVDNIVNNVENVTGNLAIGGLIGGVESLDLDRVKNKVTKVVASRNVVGEIGGLIGGVYEDIKITRVVSHAATVRATFNKEYNALGGLIGLCELSDDAAANALIANIENVATVSGMSYDYEYFNVGAGLIGSISGDNDQSKLNMGAIFSLAMVLIDEPYGLDYEEQIMNDRNIVDDLSTCMAEIVTNNCFYSRSLSVGEEGGDIDTDPEGILSEKFEAKDTTDAANDSNDMVKKLNEYQSQAGDRKGSWASYSYSYTDEEEDKYTTQIPGLSWK